MSLIQKIMLVIGMFVGSIIVFLLGMFLWAMIFTSGLKAPIEKQLVAIQMEDFATAYSYTTSNFQSVTSLVQFKKFINQYSVLRNNKSIKFEEREIDSGTGYVLASLISRSGETRLIKYRLVKEHGTWKIEAMVIDPVESTNSRTNTHSENKTSEPVNESETTTEHVALDNIYQNSRYKFSVLYPRNWVYKSPYAFETIFSNTGADTIMQVNVHAILVREHGKYRDNQKYVNDVMTNLMSAGARNVTVEDKGPVPLIRASNLQAEYTMLRYTFLAFQ